MLEPVERDVHAQQIEQPRLGLEREDSSGWPDPVGGREREVAPVGAGVDEHVAGAQNAGGELRFLRFVAAGVADLARDRIA